MSKVETIYFWLIEQFATNAIRIGGKLPSEHELCLRFGTSRPQVREALARLLHEGLIETRRGKGSFRKATTFPSQSKRDIAVILPHLSGYVYPALVEEAERAIREKGFQALFSCSGGSQHTEAEVLKRLTERPLAGILISPSFDLFPKSSENGYLLREFSAKGIPVVILDHQWDGFSCIYLDDFRAGQRAAHYLLEKGHQSLGLCSRSGHTPFVLRGQGFKTAFLEHQKNQGFNQNVFSVSELYLSEEQRPQWGALIRNYLASSQRPSALFCVNDILAMEVWREALAVGLRIPEDFSLVGFDNAPLVTEPYINLTTFEYPAGFIGRRGVQLLFELLEQEKNTPPTHHIITIEPILIERSSVSYRIPHPKEIVL
ncbi:MAG: GntR family transcriptional regulator [Treponemataceae bacterium]|nr:GntR family transcriptional regulator [Treponemataceae bacterium]